MTKLLFWQLKEKPFRAALIFFHLIKEIDFEALSKSVRVALDIQMEDKHRISHLQSLRTS